MLGRGVGSRPSTLRWSPHTLYTTLLLGPVTEHVSTVGTHMFGVLILLPCAYALSTFDLSLEGGVLTQLYATLSPSLT